MVATPNVLCAVPAFRALRCAYPGASISLIGLPSTGELAARFPRYIDELIEFPGYPGIPEVLFDARRLPSFLARMQFQEMITAVL